MANAIAAGVYRIVCAKCSGSDTIYCLDVARGDTKSGANVQLWTKLFAASQYWRLDYDKNGSARFVSLASGKSLDVYAGTMANGTNVRQFNDNGTAAQRWDIVADGYDANIEGTAYLSYKILSHKSNTYALDFAGNNLAKRTNVQIYTASTTDAQRWCFVPQETFASGGVYELRSMLKTSMCVDVSGASHIKGANIQLYSRNGTNAQKFYVTQEESSSKWSLMNVESGMYVDVASASTAVGANVQQYTDNDTRAQRWKITTYGTTTIDGTECTVVTLGSWVTGSGTTRFMDVKDALTTNKANILLGANESGATDYSQRFALFPTKAKDPDLVVPANLGWVTTMEKVAKVLLTEPEYEEPSFVLDEAEVLYPAWTTATSWPTDSANGYQWRYRQQTRSAKTGTWGSFGSWTEWMPVAVRVDGKRVWAADGLPAEVPSGCMALQYELQVRAISYVGDEDDDDTTGGELYTGEFAAATLRALAAVDLEFGETLGFGPEGLRIPYTTDYDGTVNIFVTSIYDDLTVAGTELLKKSVVFEDMDSEGSVLIPFSGLKRWIEEGETVRVSYFWTVDEGWTNEYNGIVLEEHDISYDTGSGLSVTPTVTVGDGRTLEVRVASANVSKAWIRKDNTVTAMTIKNKVGKILYPFGSDLDWELFVAAHSSDGDSWGIAYLDGTEFSNLLSPYRACHAFNWDGGSFVLEVREGEYLETNYTIENDSQSYKLNKREWDAYRFGETKSGKLKAEGTLYDLLDLESTKSDLEDLLDARHVTYRSPHGDMFDVAVLSASMVCNRDIWTVSIEMARETV